jgi:pyruvate formate-lyase activating enzyme-like uncharacterized protein
MVLFVTGKCSTGCFYCPISSRKRGRDLIFADELKASSMEDVFHEARMIGARGTGITGGDPLFSLERTLAHIRALKDEFGQKHHIHLYTSSIDRSAYEKLVEAGLDELRIHPAPAAWAKPGRTCLAEAVRGLGIPTGIEVPAIPGRAEELRTLIDYVARSGLDFVNLNELEFSETNAQKMHNQGFKVKNDLSAAAAGSEEMAIELAETVRGIPVHYCSSSFKDSIQLRRRLLRRARHIARPSDLITDDGTLMKGVIENEIALAQKMLADEGVPRRLMHLDEEKKRLEVAPWVLEELSTSLPMSSYIVEEYPTADRLEVERRRL